MRLFLTIILLAMLFCSCNSKVQVAATNSQIDSILSSDMTKPPVFKDSLLSDYSKEYDTFVKEYLNAIKDADDSKITELQKQSQELVGKAKTISDKLQTPAQLDKFQRWLNKQQEKIQTLNNIK